MTAWTAVTLVLGAMAVWSRPETRLGAVIAWIVVAAIFHLLSGESVRAGSVICFALFSLPVVSTLLAGYELHEGWGLSMSWGLLGLVVILGLVGAIFFRTLIAAGSADYPYDD